MEFYTSNGVEVSQLDVLNSLIDEILIEQGAARDGYSVTDSEVEQLYASQKQSVEAQNGVTLTDAEFTSLVEDTYGTVQDYKDYLKLQYLTQIYVSGAKADVLAQVAEPTDSEIRAWYRQNSTTFTLPERVRLSLIAMEKTGDSAVDAEKKATSQAKQAFDQAGGEKRLAELKAETAAKVSAAKEAAAAAEEIVASVDRRAAFVPASTPSVLARLFGAKTEPAKVELSPAAYKKLRETAKNGAESCVKLTQARDNTELVQMLNEEVSELRQQFNDEVCQLRQQLREKDQMIEQLLPYVDKFRRLEKKIGREQLDKLLYSSQVQQQPRPVPKTNAHAKTRDRSDFSR